MEATGPGSLATDTQGSMAPWYMEEQVPWLWLVDPGDRSKATSFSWKEIDDSERLSGEAVLLCEHVVWWTITIARSISRPGLRDLLRLLLRLPPMLLHWLATAWFLRASSRRFVFLRTVPRPASASSTWSHS